MQGCVTAFFRALPGESTGMQCSTAAAAAARALLLFSLQCAHASVPPASAPAALESTGSCQQRCMAMPGRHGGNSNMRVWVQRSTVRLSRSRRGTLHTPLLVGHSCCNDSSVGRLLVCAVPCCAVLCFREGLLVDARTFTRLCT